MPWGRDLPDANTDALFSERGSGAEPVHSFALRSLHGRNNALMSAPPRSHANSSGGPDLQPSADASLKRDNPLDDAKLSDTRADRIPTTVDGTDTSECQHGTGLETSGTNSEHRGASTMEGDARTAGDRHELGLRSQLEQLASGMAILHDVSDNLRASLLVAFLRRAIDTYHSLSTHHCRVHQGVDRLGTDVYHAVEAVRCMKLALVCLFAVQTTAEPSSPHGIGDAAGTRPPKASSHNDDHAFRASTAENASVHAATTSTPSTTSVLPVPHAQLLTAPGTDDVLAALLEQVGDVLSQMDT